MRKNDYKPLGDYIELVNVRNRDLAITNLVGVSIEKRFIPSIANIIGTDLSPYKVIRHNQFAYGPVTSRNGEKITIALYKDTADGILSQAYEVFRIKDEEQLLPEYLMLWVQRPEFDRYARFKSHGSVREIFSWEEMCNVMLPIPPIAEQRKIVEQHQTIERRIKNNEALIQKLEATAQALYHHTFVEGIDKANLPEGWKSEKLSSLIIRQNSGDWGSDKAECNYTNEVYCIRGTDIPKASVCNKDLVPTRFIKSTNIESKLIKEGEIVIEISGGTDKQSTGRCCLITDELLTYYKKPIICSNFCRVLQTSPGLEFVIFASLRNAYSQGVFFKYENSSNNIHNLDLDGFANDLEVIIPTPITISYFSQQFSTILSYIHHLGHEIELLLKAKLFINSNIC